MAASVPRPLNKVTHSMELTPEHVKEIVTEYVKANYGYNDSTKITFTLRETGDDRFGPPVKEFGGCRVSCDK